MATTYFRLTTLKLVALLICVFALSTVNFTQGQSCSASFLVSNFTLGQSPLVQCQIGYIQDNLALQCRPYDIVYDENNGKPCNLTSECQLSFVCSSTKICVPSSNRRLGEKCLARESCVSPFNCVNGVCAEIVTVSDRKKGEKCYETNYAENTVHSCGVPYGCTYSLGVYKCYEYVYSESGGVCGTNNTNFRVSICKNDAYCNAGKCIPYVYSGVAGDNCNSITPDAYLQCNSQHYCSSGKCYTKLTVGLGEVCNNFNTTAYSTNICGSGLSCYLGTCVNYLLSQNGAFCGYNSSVLTYYNCYNGVCNNQLCVPQVQSPIGGLCDVTNANGEFTCKSDSLTLPYCFNNTCKARGKLGESCQESSKCISPLVGGDVKDIFRKPP